MRRLPISFRLAIALGAVIVACLVGLFLTATPQAVDGSGSGNGTRPIVAADVEPMAGAGFVNVALLVVFALAVAVMFVGAGRELIRLLRERSGYEMQSIDEQDRRRQAGVLLRKGRSTSLSDTPSANFDPAAPRER